MSSVRDFLYNLMLIYVLFNQIRPKKVKSNSNLKYILFIIGSFEFCLSIMAHPNPWLR